VASNCTTIVVIETNFNCVEFVRREVVPGFYLKGHGEHPGLYVRSLTPALVLAIQDEMAARSDVNRVPYRSAVGEIRGFF
jgi:hypothetical protein